MAEEARALRVRAPDRRLRPVTNWPEPRPIYNLLPGSYPPGGSGNDSSCVRGDRETPAGMDPPRALGSMCDPLRGRSASSARDTRPASRVRGTSRASPTTPAVACKTSGDPPFVQPTVHRLLLYRIRCAVSVTGPRDGPGMAVHFLVGCAARASAKSWRMSASLVPRGVDIGLPNLGARVPRRIPQWFRSPPPSFRRWLKNVALQPPPCSTNAMTRSAVLP